MRIGKTLYFDTVESPAAVFERLSAVVLRTDAISLLRPVRTTDWIAQRAGKRFVGRLGPTSFKLGLLAPYGGRLQVRGSVVVIEGEIRARGVRVRLRPPVFIQAFLVAFAVAVTAAIVLSFFGPLGVHPVQVLLALVLALPFVVVAGFFRREARLAEQALRESLAGT